MSLPDILSHECGAPKSAAPEGVSPTATELFNNLLAQLDRAEERAADYMVRLVAAQRRIKALEENEGHLYRALAPFADIARPIDAGWADGRRLASLNCPPIKIGDVRRALALVTLRTDDGSGSTSVAAPVVQQPREEL